MKKLTLLLFISTILIGCVQDVHLRQTKTFVFDEQDKNTGRAPDLSVAQNFFFFGLFQSAYINASEVCGGHDNISRVETNVTSGNSLATLLTLGMYSPRQVDIYCKASIEYN